MFYDGYHFWGMHLIWWFIWIILLFWIFATPFGVPGQRRKKDSPLDILQKRFASGQITKEEYQELTISQNLKIEDVHQYLNYYCHFSRHRLAGVGSETSF